MNLHLLVFLVSMKALKILLSPEGDQYPRGKSTAR